jgi:hypothetical protein
VTQKYKLERFVPILHATMDTPAWHALSHGAKALYVSLKRRFNSKLDNNGKIFLSQRAARKELGGSGFIQIKRWFGELEHSGFIVMTTPGHLGVEGKGRAPHWRLTELPCGSEPPTRDFARWNGAPFRAARKNKTPHQNSGAWGQNCMHQKAGAWGTQNLNKTPHQKSGAFLEKSQPKKRYGARVR